MKTLQSTIFIEFDVNTKKITFLRGDNVIDYDSNTTSIYARVKYKNLSGNTVYLTPSELEDYKFSLYTIKPMTNNVTEITGKVTDELKENVYGGVVKFEIPRVCTNRSGIVKCEIHIKQENKRIGSSNFVLDVKQSLVTAFDDELLEDEDFPVLKQLICEVQNANNIDDNNRSKTSSYSSDKIETIKEDLTSQINAIGEGITSTQTQQLSVAYNHSQSTHAPSNAEANVQVDWNETNTTSDSYIKNKPTNLATIDDIPTVPTKTSQLTNDSGYITNVPDEYITETELNAKGYVTISQIPTVPTNVSQLTNDAHYTTEQYVNDVVHNASISGGYTHPATHPASMITGLSTVATSGSYNDLTDKPIIPTRTSQLSNDSDFVDSAFVSRKIADASLSGGEVDLSGYVTKEIGNANQITFADGQTFQAKLDNGTLKGEKGDQGERGEQGLQGIKGDKGDKGDPGTDGTNGQDGENGATFTPSIDNKGNLSWTNDKGLVNPPTVNIKADPGEPGTGSDTFTYLDHKVMTKTAETHEDFFEVTNRVKMSKDKLYYLVIDWKGQPLFRYLWLKTMTGGVWDNVVKTLLYPRYTNSGTYYECYFSPTEDTENTLMVNMNGGIVGNEYTYDVYLYEIEDEMQEYALRMEYGFLSPSIKLANTSDRHFRGKKASALGDSLTAFGSGGHYIQFVKNMLGLKEVAQCGIGGSRVSGTSDACFWQDSRVNELMIDSDYIIIKGGTNDAPYIDLNQAVTMDNCNVETFVGAYNVLLSKIYYKYLKLNTGYYAGNGVSYSGVTQVDTPKDIKIYLITPPKSIDNNIESRQKCAEIVKKIGLMWGIPVVDANGEMQMNPFNYPSDHDDKVHYPLKFYYNLAKLIVGKMRETDNF